MSKADKIKDRVLSKPKDLKWSEFISFMKCYGYELLPSKGTSHRKFYNPTTGRICNSCKPHNPEIVKTHILDQTLEHLREAGHIK